MMKPGIKPQLSLKCDLAGTELPERAAFEANLENRNVEALRALGPNLDTLLLHHLPELVLGKAFFKKKISAALMICRPLLSHVATGPAKQLLEKI